MQNMYEPIFADLIYTCTLFDEINATYYGEKYMSNNNIQKILIC